MLDVHPPHEPIHGVRDFMLHIATITIGLLIALALESGVEALHHRHMVREAREQLRGEIEENRLLLAQDRRNLKNNQGILRNDIVLLTRLKGRFTSTDTSAFRLPWAWSGPLDAAWQTAREDGALALMPYTDAHGLALVYGQQDNVNDQATAYINHVYAARAPFTASSDLNARPDPNALTPSQVDESIRALETVLADMQYLDALMTSLDNNYASALHDLFPQ